MGFSREDSRRAEAVGYYVSYDSDASDVLGYITGDIMGVEPEERSHYEFPTFKVTVTVEKL